MAVEPEQVRRAARERIWAWVLIGLTPVAVVVGVGVFVAMLALTGTVSFPSDRFGAAFEPVGLVASLVVTGIVVLAVPSLAAALATDAVQKGDPRARSAVTAAWIAFALAFALDGAPGVVVWGPVPLVRLRRRRPSMPPPDGSRTGAGPPSGHGPVTGR